MQTIQQISDGTVEREKQNNAEATYAPILKKEDGSVDWSLPSHQIYNRLRGFKPWPGAYTTFAISNCFCFAQDLPGSSLHRARSEQKTAVFCGMRPGHFAGVSGTQPAGKKRISAEAFLNGYKLAENEILGDSA